MKLKNYYKILNIKKDATPEQVKDAYRKLVKFWHPDVNPSPNSHEKIIEINEAYEILNNKDKREVYDRIYNEYFGITSAVETTESNQESRSNERYTEYRYDDKTSADFDDLQNWINQARIKTDEIIKKGLKKVDSSLETGFYAIGEIGNFFSILFAIGILGAIGFSSMKYIIELISGANDLSVLGLIFSVIGIVVCVLVIIGWAKGNLNEE